MLMPYGARSHVEIHIFFAFHSATGIRVCCFSLREKSKKQKKSSPKKQVAETKAGSGAGFKSKEFIESDSSSSMLSSDDDDKPLKVGV